MTRPSRRVIEEACWLLSAAASNNGEGRFYETIAHSLGLSDAAWGLANDAFEESLSLYWSSPISPLDPELDAEAEALLRTGWRPSQKGQP